jgi:hypothetical protein
MSASGTMIHPPRQFQHDENEVKLDNAWKNSIAELHHDLEKMYFISIYFNQQTALKKYQTGKYAVLQQQCLGIITGIYDTIIPLIKTDNILPSQNLKRPEAIQAEIIALLNEEITKIEVKKDASRNSPDRILKTTLQYMRDYLQKIPADRMDNNGSTSRASCFFKASAEDERSYNSFLKLAKSHRNIAHFIFKHHEFKKACKLTEKIRLEPELFSVTSEIANRPPHPEPKTPSERRQHLEWRLQAGHHELEAHVKPLKAKLVRAQTFIETKKEKPKVPRAVSFDPIVKTFRRNM